MQAFKPGFFSIPANDLNTAQEFYKFVMGWDFNPRDSQFIYVIANDEMIGAIEAKNEKFQPSESGLLLYFRADFMAKALERVQKAGGIILEKVAIDGGQRGYTAKILDPSKNAIGFWAPED